MNVEVKHCRDDYNLPRAGAPSPPQKQILKCSKRFRMLVCGTKTGMTFMRFKSREKAKGRFPSVLQRSVWVCALLKHTHRLSDVKYLISNMREFWGLAHCKYVIIHHPTCWNTIRQRGCVKGGGGLGAYLHIVSDLIISFYLNGTTVIIKQLCQTPFLYSVKGGTNQNTEKQKLFCDRREESAQQHLTASSEPNGGRSLIKF